MPGGWSRHGCRSTSCQRISRCESVEHLLDSRSFRTDIELGQTHKNASGGRLHFGRGSAKVVPRGIAGHQVIDLDHGLKQFFSALSANVKVALDRLCCIPRCSAIRYRSQKDTNLLQWVATEHTQNYLGDPVRGGVTYP